jgi:hypothetical protein
MKGWRILELELQTQGERNGQVLHRMVAWRSRRRPGSGLCGDARFLNALSGEAMPRQIDGDNCKEADMKLNPSRIILVACLGVCPGAFAQIGAGAPAAGAAPPGTPPVANPNSSPITGQNNNPSATSPTANGNTPISPMNPQMPPTVGSPPAPGAAGSLNNGTGQLFATLDQSHKGYLNQGDVASNPYLSVHFQQCDTNHDARLSQDEVGACLQQMPPEH